MRSAALSGNGVGSSGAGAGSSGGSGNGAGGGAGDVVAQAASTNGSSTQNNLVGPLVTEPDTHHINFGRSQATSRDVQFVKIFNGPDIDTEVIPIVYLRALYARFDAVQGKFCTSPVRIVVRGK